MPAATRTPTRRRLTRPLPDRPSIIDPWLRGDVWIKGCTNGECVVLYVQCQPIRTLAALPLDLVSLNTRLHDMRHRLPRGMVRVEVGNSSFCQ